MKPSASSRREEKPTLQRTHKSGARLPALLPQRSNHSGRFGVCAVAFRAKVTNCGEIVYQKRVREEGAKK